MKKQFGEMHSKMQEQMYKSNGQSAHTNRPESAQPQKKKEEYIDYEEIKD